MLSKIDLSSSKYAPNLLLNWVGETLQVNSDAALARALGVAPTAICAMRGRRIPIGPSLLIKMHDLLGVPIRELRKRMGVEDEATIRADTEAEAGAGVNDEVLRITPAEKRAIRLFRSVPEEGRPKFFELMHTICSACDWSETVHASGQVIPIDSRLPAATSR